MIEHLTANDFPQRAREALDDTRLRGALRKATDLFSERRKSAMSGVPDWEELRERARRIKEETLSHLHHYLTLFERNAEAAGARVHWARSAEEACRILVDIAREANAKTIVKSKSMTTEEIGLNTALESAGFFPVETDLGEWIIQLAKETPSHIIVPAIHKTREQIADLFESKLATHRTDDPEELTKIARRILRGEFAAADLGISGVNFAVAATGSLLILENEGNVRLTTSLPRVHVAVMGLEKVIPKLEDLDVFLKLLPRSGTGQHLTSYQSLLTGPGGHSQGEGPEVLHIVLIDNGRTAMLETPITRQSLACIRCGACLNVCPVYQQVGGHAYGSVYPGPIGAVITPQLAGLDKARELPFASSLCGACRDVCPVKIEIPKLLLHLRAQIKGGHLPPKDRRAARTAKRQRRGFRLWAFSMSTARRYAFSAGLARLGARLGLRGGRPRWFARRFAGVLASWTTARELRSFAKETFRDRWRKELSRKDSPR